MEKKRICALAAQYQIQLGEKELNDLSLYEEVLLEWNQRMNLTAITQADEIEVKHFLDSLILAARTELKGALVDVGSGAGFPGVVIKIHRPELKVTLMEPTGKRVAFLQELTNRLNLSVETVKERAEEAARKQWREHYDIATARAVAALPVLCEYCLPLVKPGGLFIAMKGEPRQEVESAKNAMFKLGGELKEVIEFNLPDGSARSLIIVEKREATLPQYPRNGGVIAKRPL